MLHWLRKIRRDKRGVAAMELALLLPFLMTLCFGLLEITFLIWATQKAEKLSVTVSDVVAQAQTVAKSDLKSLVGSSSQIMEPFPFAKATGRVIITSAYREVGDDKVKIKWRWDDSGSTLVVTSKIGQNVGDEAKLPAELTMNEKDNVIIAEVFYDYKPMATGLLFGETLIYRRAFFKPRLGALTTPPS